MIRMLTINADKALAKLGFAKVEEDKDYIVQYERKAEQGYIQCLDIVHKASGEHLIQSYQKDLNADGFNNAVGLTAREVKLAAKKMRQMGWRQNRRTH